MPGLLFCRGLVGGGGTCFLPLSPAVHSSAAQREAPGSGPKRSLQEHVNIWGVQNVPTWADKTIAGMKVMLNTGGTALHKGMHQPQSQTFNSSLLKKCNKSQIKYKDSGITVSLYFIWCTQLWDLSAFSPNNSNFLKNGITEQHFYATLSKKKTPCCSRRDLPEHLDGKVYTLAFSSRSRVMVWCGGDLFWQCGYGGCPEVDRMQYLTFQSAFLSLTT